MAFQRDVFFINFLFLFNRYTPKDIFTLDKIYKSARWTDMSMVKLDPYKHKERYLAWKTRMQSERFKISS